MSGEKPCVFGTRDATPKLGAIERKICPTLLILPPGVNGLPNLPNFISYGLVVPFAWIGPRYTFYTGDSIIDPSGHIQTVTSAPFPSGGVMPSWNDSGGVTTDDNLTWQDEGLVTGVTACFSFYFRVRFDMDQLDFEEFLSQLWTIGGSSSKNGAGYLKLTSSRVAGV